MVTIRRWTYIHHRTHGIGTTTAYFQAEENTQDLAVVDEDCQEGEHHLTSPRQRHFRDTI